MSNKPNEGEERTAQSEKDAIDHVMGSEPLRIEQSLSIPSDAHKSAATQPDLPEDAENLDELMSENDSESIDRADVIGEGARWFAGWCLRFLITAAALYVSAMILGKIWAGVLPILLALIVSTVLAPPAVFLMKHRWPRALSALTVILGALAVLGGVVAVLAPTVQSQFPELRRQFTDGIQEVQNIIQAPPFNVKDEQILDALDQGSTWLQERSGDIANTVFQGISVVSSAAVTLMAMLVLTFFFIKDGQDFLPWLRRLTGRRLGWHLTEVLTRSWNTLSGYIRTQAIVSLIDAVFIGAGLAILNVPLAMVLAVVTFFAGFIPIVGAFTAGFIAVVVALVANGLTTAILVLLIIIAVQQIEGNILSPILQSKAMDLHAAIVLLVVLLGGGIFGIIGAFLAVPVTAVVAVWFRYLGDLTDLRTGDKTAKDIEFATDAGSISGIQIEAAGRAMRDRLASFRLGSDDSDSSAESAVKADARTAGKVSPDAGPTKQEEGTMTKAFHKVSEVVSGSFSKKKK
ncbi:AI-2E family transporter [Corynebacterium sp. HMSC074C05]|uniref:AI-2E family transporter n=1 Tax=Corynebacterium sp. HMSC074C05 TaxID=1739534 RepID=UPI0008AA5101|nr:AI-2E family transporter [Corynebacterium sp. HMSC074C05]OHR33778.1 AI-2E family transporter [Corynebacterium sp. HMSC074C05]